MDPKIFEEFSKKFPKSDIKNRIIREDGKERCLSYISGRSVIERLNFTNPFWNFIIIREIVNYESKQVAVLGRLTILDEDGHDIIKEQWGSSVISTYSDGSIISLGDSLKIATTDSLKKCATMLGVALYLYEDEQMKDSMAPIKTEATEKKVETLRDDIKKITKAQINTIMRILKENNLEPSVMVKLYNVEKVSDMKYQDASHFIVHNKEIVEASSSESNSDSETIINKTDEDELSQHKSD